MTHKRCAKKLREGAAKPDARKKAVLWARREKRGRRNVRGAEEREVLLRAWGRKKSCGAAVPCAL